MDGKATMVIRQIKLPHNTHDVQVEAYLNRSQQITSDYVLNLKAAYVFNNRIFPLFDTSTGVWFLAKIPNSLTFDNIISIFVQARNHQHPPNFLRIAL